MNQPPQRPTPTGGRRWSRRHVLGLGGGVLAGSGLLALAPGSALPAVSATGFAELRRRAVGLQLGDDIDTSVEPFRTALATLSRTAAQHVASLAPAPGALWPDLSWTTGQPFDRSAAVTASYDRLRLVAEALVRPGTALTGDQAVLDGVLAGLEQLDAEVYGASGTTFGNWWDFQIGAPQRLATTATLVFDHLTADQRERYAAAIASFLPDSVVGTYTGTSTGANRVDLCRGIIGGALLVDDADRLALARDALSPVFPYVTAGDGYYPDGSFVQHTWVPYIGGYGAVLIDGLGWVFSLLNGSPWEVVDPNREQFLDTIDAATAPFIFNGLMMDDVSGRGISRAASSDFGRGTPVLGAIAVIADGVGPEQRRAWRSMVKGWLTRNDVDNPLSSPTQPLARLARLQAIMDDPDVAPAPEPVEHRVFGSMDRTTHRRPGWAASLSMSSARIAHYEVGNGENLRGWHTGAGWLQWWTDDTAGQYSDGYWPTVDPYRLPGTTTSQLPLADGAGGQWGEARPGNHWAGGTTDGELGVAGMELQGLGSTLRARKSWFSTDEAVVCLGAGITSRDGHEVDSVVDTRLLDDRTRLRVDGVPQARGRGGAVEHRDTGWAHLDGHAGYLFPAGGSLSVVDEQRTGRWRDINTGGPTDPVTRRHLSLYVDHGVDPSDGSYAYVLLPGATARRTARLAADPGWLEVVDNRAEVQSVSVASLGLVGANFFAGASTGALTASGPASVLVRDLGDGTALVCVSDPTRSATGLTLTWERAVESVLERPRTLRGAGTGTRLVLELDPLDRAAGATQRVLVRLR